MTDYKEVRARLFGNIQDESYTAHDTQSSYKTQEQVSTNYADDFKQADHINTLSQADKKKDDFIREFDKNFFNINSQKILIDCISDFECYLLNNQEFVGFDRDNNLKKINLLVKEKQGQELICKQIVLQRKLIELLDQADKTIQRKEEKNKQRVIFCETDAEQEDVEDVTALRLATNRKELLLGTSLGKIIRVNLDRFEVIDAYQTIKQKITDIDSNDKMIVFIYDKTLVYRIMKTTERRSGNQLKGPFKKIESGSDEMSGSLKKILFQVSPYSNHFIIRDGTKRYEEYAELYDSENFLNQKIKVNVNPVPLCCFLENQSLAFITKEKDLIIKSLFDEKEIYKKEKIVEMPQYAEIQFDEQNQCIVISEKQGGGVNVKVQILDFQGNDIKTKLKVMKAQGVKTPGSNVYLKIYDGFKICNSKQPLNRFVEAQGVKTPRSSVYLQMFDGTKICNTKEPQNSFLEREILKISSDDIYYFSQDRTNYPFIYQTHDNEIFQKELNSCILSQNQKKFLSFEKNEDQSNEYNEFQRKIYWLQNQKSAELLGATSDNKVIISREQKPSWDDQVWTDAFIFYDLNYIGEIRGSMQVQVKDNHIIYNLTPDKLQEILIIQNDQGEIGTETKDIRFRLGDLVNQEQDINYVNWFQIKKIKLTSSQNSLILLIENKIFELDLQDESKEPQVIFENKQKHKVVSFDLLEDDQNLFITNEKSEILICRKNQESQNFEEINKVSIHKKKVVYCYYLGNNRTVSIGYEDDYDDEVVVPDYEKPIEVFYWDTTDKKNWKKLFSFDCALIELQIENNKMSEQIQNQKFDVSFDNQFHKNIINDYRCIPEAFILDGKVRLFSQAEVEFGLDYTNFKDKDEQRIIGPSYSKFFFQRVKILLTLKDVKEIEQQLQQLGQFVVYPQGFTLLGYLVLQQETKLVRELLNFQNVKFIRDFTGNTPLTHAMESKNFEIINLLLEFILDKPNLIALIDSKELTLILKLKPEKWPLLLAKTVCEVEQDIDLEMIEGAEKTYLAEEPYYPEYKQHTKQLIDQLTNTNAQIEDKNQVVVKKTLILVDITPGSAETTNLLKEIQLFENQEIYKQEYVINLIQYKWQKISIVNYIFLTVQFIQTFVILIHSYKPGEHLPLFIMLFFSLFYFLKELIICINLQSSQNNQQSGKNKQKGIYKRFAFTSWLTVLIFVLQITYTLTNLIGVISTVDYILPILNLSSWILLVTELGTFEIVMKFHIIFILSVKSLSGFLIYFVLMIFSFVTTLGILKKTLFRIEKIGNESRPTSPEFYKMHNAYFYDEQISQDLSDNILFVWKAIMSGELQNNQVWIGRIYGYFIALLANIILLNLIVSIMGDTYQESITAMNKKLLKEKCYRILRHECFFSKQGVQKKSLIWIQYIDQVGENWVSQADIISRSVKNAFLQVTNKLLVSENKQQDQLINIENKMQEQLTVQLADSEKLDELKKILSADKKKADEVKQADQSDKKKADELQVSLRLLRNSLFRQLNAIRPQTTSLGELQGTQSVDNLKLADQMDNITQIITTEIDSFDILDNQGNAQVTERIALSNQKQKLVDFQSEIKNNFTDMKAQVAQGQKHATQMQAQIVDIKSQVVDIKDQVAEIKNQLTEFINYLKKKQ